ncbi:MAG: Zn-ribbon domain-containing OB-fold protein [Nitrososphaeria archaeon]|nr:Zn-ribbon domain-containing OB-fold protein [Nitrososphaeria archaeon]MDW8021096.1 Zn-ribbon domain-containing OB-fold protein [Nitrososphaerota archaeon]
MRVPRYWRNIPFRYRLVGWRCNHCGTFHQEKPIICKRCRHRELYEVELPKTGKLVAYTIVQSTPKEFNLVSPYAIGLVELDDGTRILAQLTDFREDELREGLRVEAVFRKIRVDGEQGIIEYGYKFRPLIE